MKVSYADISKYVRNADHYYDAMQRSGWLMPSRHCALNTMDFMNQVREKTLYCPKTEFLKSAPRCYSIPPIEHLMVIMENFLQRIQTGGNYDHEELSRCLNLMYEMRKRKPNAQWLVTIISIWEPTNEIFAKNYRYVRPKKAAADILLDNSDGFFTNLAQLTDTEIKKSKRLNIPRKDRLLIKKDALAERKRQLAQYEMDLEAQIQELAALELNRYADRPELPQPQPGDQENDQNTEQILAVEQTPVQERHIPGAIEEEKLNPLEMSLQQLRAHGIPFDTTGDIDQGFEMEEQDDYQRTQKEPENQSMLSAVKARQKKARKGKQIADV